VEKRESKITNLEILRERSWFFFFHPDLKFLSFIVAKIKIIIKDQKKKKRTKNNNIY
jgi:hypothetical protein